MNSKKHWYEIKPEDAVDIDASKDENIITAKNELGEPCPWPWEAQTLKGVGMGQYHCRYCGAMVMAGLPHIDYR